MPRFVHVGFSFAGVPKMRDLEPVFSAIGDDWIRYSQNSWILWTDKSTPEIFWSIRPFIDANDQVMVASMVVDDIFGSMAPWVWNWMKSKMPGKVDVQGEDFHEWLRKYLSSAPTPTPKLK
jgi:hypothetical protein